MTDTDEFLKRGHEASFFKDLMDRVSLEAEKQYSEYAKNAKPHFGNHPYWQMPTDEPVVQIDRLAANLLDMLYEEEKIQHWKNCSRL